MKIYVASSWRNPHQPGVVAYLRELGHEVYDFRNPPNKSGFGWRQVDLNYSGGPVLARHEERLVHHPIAIAGYAADLGALREADACVYVLPCGRSASWEYGVAFGMGKRCFVLWIGEHEPELMFREAPICSSVEELGRFVGGAAL